MEKFVVINKRILDYSEYEADFTRIKKIISLDVKGYFACRGFEVKNARNKKFRKTLLLYNDDLDMEVEVNVRKKNVLSFV